ncbi:MAG: hypothetical protein RLN87_11700 [Parasphingopyxis sp.]|uniref:hypothetical protein n=1 Tax=Parasphingopyxis sp. TaxID=1920299 RepID=UPI0032EB6302
MAVVSLNRGGNPAALFGARDSDLVRFVQARLVGTILWQQLITHMPQISRPWVSQFFLP